MPAVFGVPRFPTYGNTGSAPQHREAVAQSSGSVSMLGRYRGSSSGAVMLGVRGSMSRALVLVLHACIWERKKRSQQIGGNILWRVQRAEQTRWEAEGYECILHSVC